MPANNCSAVMRPEKQSERILNATRRDYSREKAVIELAQKGDAKAFEQLYTAHKGRVYSLCVRMTRGNTGLAEDLTQEVFLQAYRKIQGFRGESAFSTWLHRVTINAVLMRLRKPVVQEISFEELQPEQRWQRRRIATWKNCGKNSHAAELLHCVWYRTMLLSRSLLRISPAHPATHLGDGLLRIR